MKKLLILLFLAPLLVFIYSCKNATKTTDNETMIFADTSRNALDWEGIYYGVLPCADCEGIETLISIWYDNTFVKKTRYLGKDDQVFESKGAFTWNEQGNIITFDDEHSQYAPGGYLVGEMQLFHLDSEGNRITGNLAENYRLAKVDGSLFGKTWKLVELRGIPVEVDEASDKIPFLLFHSAESRFSGNAGCNNIMGGYELAEENRIRFTQVASTMMACPDMELERAFIQMLETVDNYSLLGDTLSLNREKIAPLARFVPVYFR